jgi:hypothetical protein
MKDWSWSQLEGLQGNHDMIVSAKPLLLLAAHSQSQIASRLVKPHQGVIKLSDFAKGVAFLFRNQKTGDQMIESIQMLGENDYLIILFLFFDS